MLNTVVSEGKERKNVKQKIAKMFVKCKVKCVLTFGLTYTRITIVIEKMGFFCNLFCIYKLKDVSEPD